MSIIKKILLSVVFIFIISNVFSQIQSGTYFDIRSENPIDMRLVVNDTVERNLINWRYEGLMVYVIADTSTWQLQTGIKNSDWVKIVDVGGVTEAVYEKELSDSETVINVGFTVTSTSMIYYNGGILKRSQWGGEGTETVILSLEPKQYDNFLIKQ